MLTFRIAGCEVAFLEVFSTLEIWSSFPSEVFRGKQATLLLLPYPFSYPKPFSVPFSQTYVKARNCLPQSLSFLEENEYKRLELFPWGSTCLISIGNNQPASGPIVWVRLGERAEVARRGLTTVMRVRAATRIMTDGV